MNNSQKNILIVDDEHEITDLLEIYIKNEGYQVFKFYSGEGVMECIEQNEIHLAILDVMLPDIDGFRLCRMIREKWFFPIIMLTAKVEETDKITGITLGADDYITKPFNPLEVLARVKGQLRRADVYNVAIGKGNERIEEEQSVFQVRGLEINGNNHTCSLYGEELSLTPIEFSLLLYLCKHMGDVVSSEELFENVWGEKYIDNNNTVFAHVARLREKMHEEARRPKFVKTVWGIGYKIEK